MQAELEARGAAVPLNFVPSAPAFDPRNPRAAPGAHPAARLNPQHSALCQRFGLTDHPARILAGGTPGAAAVVQAAANNPDEIALADDDGDDDGDGGGHACANANPDEIALDGEDDDADADEAGGLERWPVAAGSVAAPADPAEIALDDD